MNKASNNEFSQFLLDQRINFMVEHRAMTGIGHCIIAGLSAWFLSTRVAWEAIAPWLACIFLAGIFTLISLQHRKPNSKGFGGDLWMIRGCASAFLMGLSWGVMPGWFYSDNDTAFMVVVFCVYTGYISAAIPTTFSYAPVFYSFAAGITLPFWLMLFDHKGEIFEFLRFALPLYVGILVYAAYNVHGLFRQWNQTTFDKLKLVDDLEKEKDIATTATLSKTQFFAAASHDLRQPLSAINLFVDSLAHRASDPKDKQTLDKINRSLRSLNKMLHSLLDISKLDASAVRYEPSPVALRSLLAQLVDEHSTHANGLSFSINVDEQLTADCDPTILRRILGNLIDNAVKFSHKGVIHLDAKPVSQTIDLQIRDSGIGIEEDQLDRIFDEFKQLNNPERNRDKGLGLGLSIVKRLCALADIPLSIDSKKNVGTTVTLSLRSSEAPLVNSQLNTPVNIEGLIVAVIDDEADILQGMQDVLSSWGCKVVVAETGDEALRKLTEKHKKPDLIISDLRLRHQDGISLIEQIRDEFNEPVPAILITGDTAPDRIQLAYDSNLLVLHKPIEANELKSAVFNTVKSTQ